MPFFSKKITDLTTDDLAELLGEGAVENVRLEFKREVPGPDDTLKKLSGFANTFGGYLIVGAEASSTDGRLVAYPGVEPQSNYRQSVIQRCQEGTWPPVEVVVSDGIPAPNTNDKMCYVIYVPESAESPHFLTKRRGAWVRTDEYSQRFETRLAEFEEIQHLTNRRSLAVGRREELHRRALERFSAFVVAEYGSSQHESGQIGATLFLSFCPQFPTRRLTTDQDLLSLVKTEIVPWRGVGFPAGQETVTQLESVLVLRPERAFSLTEANTWGQLMYCSEIEERARAERGAATGIHLYSFVGHLLVFLEHARRMFGKLGYSGPLLIRASLKRVRGKPFLHFPYGDPSAGPASRIDDEIVLDLSTLAAQLDEHRDEVASELLGSLFFSLNWPQQGANTETRADLLEKGKQYNNWKVQ